LLGHLFGSFYGSLGLLRRHQPELRIRSLGLGNRTFGILACFDDAGLALRFEVRESPFVGRAVFAGSVFSCELALRYDPHALSFEGVACHLNFRLRFGFGVQEFLIGPFDFFGHCSLSLRFL